MSPVVAKENIYSEDGGRLLVAQGDIVPEGVEYKKGQVTEEEVRLSPAQEAALFNAQAPSQERSMEIAQDNATIQAEERMKDAANHGLSMEELADRALVPYDAVGVGDKSMHGPKEPGKRLQDANNPAVEAGLANPATAGEDKAEAKEAADDAEAKTKAAKK